MFLAYKYESPKMVQKGQGSCLNSTSRKKAGWLAAGPFAKQDFGAASDLRQQLKVAGSPDNTAVKTEARRFNILYIVPISKNLNSEVNSTEACSTVRPSEAAIVSVLNLTGPTMSVLGSGYNAADGNKF